MITTIKKSLITKEKSLLRLYSFVPAILSISMKKSKLMYLFVFVLLSMLLATTVYAATDLESSTATDKTSYTEGETIEVALEVANHTGSGATMSFLSGCQMSMEIEPFNENTAEYDSPIYNDQLYPRNCATHLTSIFLDDNKKAIWFRNVEPNTASYPEMPPGKYRVHSYPTGYDDALWTQTSSAYVEFTVVSDQVNAQEADLVNIETLDLSADEITKCTETGGVYDDCSSACPDLGPDEVCIALCVPKCECPEGTVWDDQSGCTNDNSLSTVIEANNTSTFNDIGGHWGESYISSLQNSGIVSGYNDGGFHPDDPINRAEFVKMSLSAASISSDTPTLPDFKFNDLVGWQIDWVYAAWERGVVHGYDEFTFAPANNVTRAEALKIALNTFNMDVPDTSQEYAFPDTIGHWAISYINKAYLEFIVSGRSDGLFYPNDPITRAEAAKVIYSLLAKLP